MSEPDVTPAQIKAALQTMMAVADAIREAGRIPAGTLYAALMPRLSAGAFDSMLAQVLRTGLVRREGDELVWVG
jgi:hypothetical protein